MRYWLFKSESASWSWDNQVAKGDLGEEWDGVRNYQARNHMRDMAIGDRGFFYHSQIEKSVVGIVEIMAEAHHDSTTDDERWECVDIKAIAPVPNPVTLGDVKANTKLAEMVLVKTTRLSVQPVEKKHFERVVKLGRYSPH